MEDIKDVLKVLKQCETNIGEERNKLQKVYEELEDILNDTDLGLDSLRNAIYYLSEKGREGIT